MRIEISMLALYFLSIVQLPGHMSVSLLSAVIIFFPEQLQFAKILISLLRINSFSLYNKKMRKLTENVKYPHIHAWRNWRS